MEPFFLVIAALLGVVFASLGAGMFYRSLFPHRWEQVAGRIEKLVVEERRSKGSRTEFRACIHYSYPVGTTRFQGYQYVGRGSFHRSTAQEDIRPYSVGQPLDVHVYKPKPSVTRLQRGLDGAGLACLAFGLLLLAFVAFRAAA
jgi:hypothetical protein